MLNSVIQLMKKYIYFTGKMWQNFKGNGFYKDKLYVKNTKVV